MTNDQMTKRKRANNDKENALALVTEIMQTSNPQTTLPTKR
jgi:hypothetical protein